VIKTPDTFISLQFYLSQLNYLLLHYMWGIFHNSVCQRCPFAWLRKFYCCQ